MHVRNDAVGDYQQNEEMLAIFELAGNRDCIVDDRGEVGGSEQRDRGQALTIMCQNFLNTGTIWI